MSQGAFAEKQITKNIFLYNKEHRIIIKDPKSLRLKQDIESKPLVVILSWLMGERKHLLKFVDFYAKQNFDAVIAHVNPWHLFWPKKGSQLIARDLVNFLAANDFYKPIVIHGFSIGGYFWSECLLQMEKNQRKFKSVVDRIAAQIWDSAPDFAQLGIGLPLALFPHNPLLQKLFRSYFTYHMETFHEQATKHYLKASESAFNNYISAPALFFVSKNDVIGTVASNQRVADAWKSRGMSVTWKCFENSPHVGHFLNHREEYLEYLCNHLRSVDLLVSPGVSNAKL